MEVLQLLLTVMSLVLGYRVAGSTCSRISQLGMRTRIADENLGLPDFSNFKGCHSFLSDLKIEMKPPLEQVMAFYIYFTHHIPLINIVVFANEKWYFGKDTDFKMLEICLLST